MEIIARIMCLVIGYFFGLFQTAYIYGKMHGIDIREHGSGNSGTTNALRVLGKKAGLIVFLGDLLKATAACVIARIVGTLYFPDIVYPMILSYAHRGSICRICSSSLSFATTSIPSTIGLF